MTTQEIVSKLWNLCNVLRDDGITYHQYVTELTYILFLKMCSETGSEELIPEEYRWNSLVTKNGIELKKFYKQLLENLGENGTGRVREIYSGAQTNIDEPKNLARTSLVTHQQELEQEVTGMGWAAAVAHHASTRHHASAQARPAERCRGCVWAAQCLSSPKSRLFFKIFILY